MVALEPFQTSTMLHCMHEHLRKQSLSHVFSLIGRSSLSDDSVSHGLRSLTYCHLFYAAMVAILATLISALLSRFVEPASVAYLACCACMRLSTHCPPGREDRSKELLDGEFQETIWNLYISDYCAINAIRKARECEAEHERPEGLSQARRGVLEEFLREGQI